ncbi:MAG: protein translocase subunit SecF [Alphaproteobacteria bacterium]
MIALVRYFPLDPGLHIFHWWRRTLMLSLVLVLLAGVGLLWRGLNLGVDFRGGVQLELRAVAGEIDIDGLRDEVDALVPGGVIQEFGGPEEALVNLPLPSAGDDDLRALALAEITRIKEGLSSDVYEFRRTEFVGPKVGGELRRAGLVATILSLLAIAIYVWFRFEWQFAIAAFLTLMHDVVLTLGFYAWSGIEFNLTTLAAILAIAGYSINDTVVIFDRVREILRRDRKHEAAHAMDEAPNRTLSRSLLTSLTTLLAILILFFFAGPLVRGLAAGLIFGVIIGTWSSIGLAIPMVRLLRFSRTQLDTAEGK